MKPKELIKILLKAGWEQKGAEGAHCHFILPGHPEKGKITVAMHNKDLKRKTLADIKKQSGLGF